LVTYEFADQPEVGMPLSHFFRVVGGRIVPYVERVFEPEPLPLTTLILGYSSQMRVEDPCFQMMGVEVPVKRSPVPVRP
jgi:hypothetical protein